MAYRFNQGDRPLPGYTIQRGVGTGGFGEVYYATSDGGKEVALKYLRDNPQVELRGATHCLNLKSPYLVAIHDLKQNEQGEYFVIMEYVNGPSLRDLMNEDPSGLGSQKAAYFLREIGKGLAYLHDRGIVHRDMKPGNIFYEDGYVKIGDYGLSKIMAASQHSGQTMSVGTVHYMAPEIGSGNYDRTIDIYAMGVMLYEMLLGRVPFSGASMGEVLMKHLTAQPTVDELPEPFPHVIRKALAKDPKDRYQTVTELISELFEVEDLSRSVAAFEPASLSTLAAHAAENLNVAPHAGPAVGVLGTGSSNVGQAVPPPVIDPGAADRGVTGRFGRIQQRVGDRVDRISGRIDASRIGQRVTEAAQRPQNWIEKIFLALIVCAGMSIGAAVISASHDQGAFALALFTSCVSIVSGVILGHWIYVKKWFVCVIETGKQRLNANGEEKSHWMPGIVSAMLVAAALFPLTPFAWNSGVVSWRGNDWIMAILSAVVLFDWRSRIESGRQGKVSLGPAFSAGLYAFLVGIIFLDDNWVPLAAMLAAASLGVQAVAGIWPARAGAGTVPGGVDTTEIHGRRSKMARTMRAAMRAARVNDGWSTDDPAAVAISRDGVVQSPPTIPPHAAASMTVGVQAIDPALLRSNTIRAVWFFTALLMLLGMIFSFASIGFLNMSDDEELAAHVIVGIVLALAFLFALSCAFPQYKKGLWRGIVRKAVFFGGLALAGSSGVAMGLVADGGEEEMLALGGIILGGVSALFVWFIPTPAYVLQKVRRPEKLELPIRRVFLVDAVSDFDSILERHTVLNGFRLKNRGEMFWLFTRGDWTAQFWQSDIRRWKTELNIAAYENATGGYRVTSQLDIDAGFSTPKQEMLRRMSEELADLQSLLNGRPLPETKLGIAV